MCSAYQKTGIFTVIHCFSSTMITLKSSILDIINKPLTIPEIKTIYSHDQNYWHPPVLSDSILTNSFIIGPYLLKF